MSTQTRRIFSFGTSRLMPLRSIHHGHTEAEKGTRRAQERSSGQKRRRPAGKSRTEARDPPPCVEEARVVCMSAAGIGLRLRPAGCALPPSPARPQVSRRECGASAGTDVGQSATRRAGRRPARTGPFHRLDAGAAHERRLDTSVDVHAEAKLKSWQSGTKDHDRKGKTDGPQADPRSRGGHMPESANRNGFELGKISAYSPADHIQVPRYVG